MSGPSSLRAALAAMVLGPIVALGLPALPVPALAPPAAAQETPEGEEESDDPLQVRITRLTPGVIPNRGAVQVEGRIRNTGEETWTSINVHPFVSSGPMTDGEELSEAVRSDPHLEVGERIVTSLDAVGDLSPGDEVGFRLRVPREDLPDAGVGVYWFGVHALGTDEAGRDSVADGRARTFLPLVNPRGRTVRTALVASLRRPVTHTPAGALARVGQWERALAPGGSLRRTVDLAAAAGDAPLTWLVDPAVIRAVSSLAVGNPERRLAGPADDGTGTAEPTEEGSPSRPPAADLDPLGADEVEEHGPHDSAVARLAMSWLRDLPELLGDAEVRGLPYGDLASDAALQHDADLHETARALSQDVLERLDVTARGVVTSLDGRLSPETLAGANTLDSVLISEEMLPAEVGPTSRISVGDREVTVGSTAAMEGGPGPNPRRAPISVRQRVLAEASLRLLAEGSDPLVVPLPNAWGPEGVGEFFRQLRALGWVELVPLAEAESGQATEVDPDALDGPERRGLTGGHFDEAGDLREAGSTLERLVAGDDTVQGEITAQALSMLSWWDARDPEQALRSLRAATYQVERTLSEVEIEGLPSVTLSSESGRFPVTISNGLDQPVAVQLRAQTDGDVRIQAPDVVEIGPGGTASVLVSAHTERLGVHNVRFRITDSEGNPLGDPVVIPIRSAQVSNIIWVVIGVGAALLVGAAALRVVRRVRRRRDPDGTGATAA